MARLLLPPFAGVATDAAAHQRPQQILPRRVVATGQSLILRQLGLSLVKELRRDQRRNRRHQQPRCARRQFERRALLANGLERPTGWSGEWRWRAARARVRLA
jgi:hypothetical protein